MDSVDKLRELPVFGAVSVDGDLNTTNQLMVCATKEEVLEIADEIEREIAERYMELPVDADGVPIRVGDKIEHRGHTGDVWLFGANEIMCTDRVCYPIGECHLAKPRTLEDVLCEMIHEYGCTDALTETIADKYAAEIRELMDGDAE